MVSAEALFVLTDLAGLAPDDAIASLVRTAAIITRAALPRPGRCVGCGRAGGRPETGSVAGPLAGPVAG